MPLESLRAALPLRLVTPVPLSQPHVIGVLRYQGQVLAALSLASLLGGHGWRQDPAVLLVVDRGDGELCALDCEAIPRPFEPARRRGGGGARARGGPGDRGPVEHHPPDRPPH